VIDGDDLCRFVAPNPDYGNRAGSNLRAPVTRRRGIECPAQETANRHDVADNDNGLARVTLDNLLPS
jgi:hypothetical protein